MTWMTPLVHMMSAFTTFALLMRTLPRAVDTLCL
jgi:hypothetical protein